MGGSISKVNCSDISVHHKKYQKPFRRHQVKIDKTKIGIPTDFRHTYHVGNESPIMDEFTDNASLHKSGSMSSDPDFLATMAQIADALQKLPLHTSSAHYTHRVSPRKLGNSISDQQIIPRRTFSLLGAKDVMQSIEVSSSMIIQSTRNEDMNYNNEKEGSILQLAKAVSIPHLKEKEEMKEGEEEADVGEISEGNEDEESPPLSPSDSISDESDFSPPRSVKQSFLEIDPSSGFHGFSSCLQSRIDAQIVELARVRSKHIKSNRNPRNSNNLMFDKPTLMI